eukprot:10337652-Alexandrium_andersonii.AAC.1
MQVHERQMAVNQVSIHRLREDVRRIPFAGPFQQGEIPGANAPLRPHLAHCEAPDSPNAGPAADTNGRATVCANLKGGRETE